MTAEIIPAYEGAVQKYDDSAFDNIAGATYLPRLQLYTSKSELCTSGSFPINHWGLVRSKTPVDLSTEVDIIIIAWRPKALDMNDGVQAFYKQETPEFQDVLARSEVKDSKCMAGPEFLVYIPCQKSFATLFCGTKTAKTKAADLKAIMKSTKVATLGSETIKTSKFTWQGMTVVACNTPVTNTPDEGEFAKIIEKFNNPKDSEVELAEDTTERAR